jgi:hypothetical protein
VLRETGETACTLVHLRKLGTLQETKLERFPKLDVAGSGLVVQAEFAINS